MNLFEENIVEFFNSLNSHEVKYILVGGLAVNYHGYSRTTGDVDLWLDDKEENRRKLVAALKDLKVEGADAFLTYPLLAGYSEIMLNNGIYIDMMKDLQFLKQENFKECYEMSNHFNLADAITVPVIHIKKLIEEKSMSTRAKDINDVQWLKKLLNKN